MAGSDENCSMPGDIIGLAEYYASAKDSNNPAVPQLFKDCQALARTLIARQPVIGYAVRMETGNFVGIWTDRSLAESICSRQPVSHGDRVIPVCEAFSFHENPLAKLLQRLLDNNTVAPHHSMRAEIEDALRNA